MNGQIEDVPGVAVSRPPDVSAFHLIVWLFAVTFSLDPEQRRRTKAMYGHSNETINPVTPTIDAFSKNMQYIKEKNRKCVVKVVADERLSQKIIEYSKNDNKIIEIHLFSPEGVVAPSFLPAKLRTHSTILNKDAEPPSL